MKPKLITVHSMDEMLIVLLLYGPSRLLLSRSVDQSGVVINSSNVYGSAISQDFIQYYPSIGYKITIDGRRYIEQKYGGLHGLEDKLLALRI